MLKKNYFLLGLWLAVVRGIAGTVVAQPWMVPALDLESGLLWQVGPSTPLPYRLVPTQLSWRSAEFIGHEFTDGARLVVRHPPCSISLSQTQPPIQHGTALWKVAVAFAGASI